MSLRLSMFSFIFLVIVVPVHATFCAFDNAPAASLLFPFVVYDYNETRGGTKTEISITNVGSEAQVLHVTLWTDYGDPFLDFNVLLTGYDVQRIDIRDILADGQLPVTVTERHTTFEGSVDLGPVSSHSVLNGEWLDGVLPEPEPTTALTEARCRSNMPGYPGQYTQPIPHTVLDLFQTWLNLSQRVETFASDACDGSFSQPYTIDRWPEPWFNNRDEYSPTWMYITVDVVENCHKFFPSDTEYWIPHTNGGQARYDNVLTGDVTWTFALSAAAGNAVHIEADRELASIVPKTNVDQPISFYHRFSSRQGIASDAREPLPTAWALRYQNADSDSPPKLRVWKGSTNFMTLLDLQTDGGQSASEVLISNCLAYTYYVWDEEENILQSNWGGGHRHYLRPNLLPMAVQEVDINQFYLPGDRGWLLFVWPPSNFGQEAAPEPPDAYQTWMGIAHDAWGTHARFVPGTPMANANCYPEQILPNLGVDYDYVDRYGYRGRTGAVKGPPAVD